MEQFADKLISICMILCLIVGTIVFNVVMAIQVLYFCTCNAKIFKAHFKPQKKHSENVKYCSPVMFIFSLYEACKTWVQANYLIQF